MRAGVCVWKRCSGSRLRSGALFYGTPRRRREVAFELQLRAQTERLAARMQELYGARADAARGLSAEVRELLADRALHAASAGAHAVARYLSGAIAPDDGLR